MSNFATISGKLMNRQFRRIDGVAWNMLTGKQGIKAKDGTLYSLVTTPAVEATDNTPAVAATYQVAGELISMDTPIPAFAMATPHSDVQVEDLVVGDNKILGWVVGKTEAALQLVDYTGHVKQYVAPKVTLMGQGEVTYLVVRNLFNLTGGQAGANNFASQLLPILALSGEGTDGLEAMLPMLLIQAAQASAAPAATSTDGAVAPAAAQATAAAAQQAQMMQALMMSKVLGKNKGDGEGSDMLQMLALTGGLGGAQAGGMNPMMMLALAGGKGKGGGNKDVLKMLALTGGLGNTQAGGMSPMLMMSLIGDADFFGNDEVPALKPVLKPALKPVLRSTGLGE